jgi:hypothetical protein
MSKKNPKFSNVTYPSQNSQNLNNGTFHKESYDIYIPGKGAVKQMMTRDQIKSDIIDKNGIEVRGACSYRYSRDNSAVIFRSANIADIVTAAETGIGWHVPKNAPSIRKGQKGYIIPTMNVMNKNSKDGVFPVVVFDITDEAQREEIE